MTKTSGHKAFTWTLGTCTAVSLAGNVAAATLLPHHLALPTPVVIAAASVAPLLLPAAVHLVPRTDDLPRRVRAVVVLAVVVAAAAAFALSFASLTAVAQAAGHPGALGMLLPVAVDVLAAASAYALVVMPADARAAAGLGDVAVARHTAADQLAPDAVHWPDSVAWLTAPVARPDPEPAAHDNVAPQPATSSDAAAQQGGAAPDGARETRDAPVTRPDHGATTLPLEPDGDTDRAVAAPLHPDPPALRRLSAVPDRDAVLADRDAEILRRDTAGESASEIGEAMGFSKSTALRHVRRLREETTA
ncbi:helix-turn-helix domain-containing protein [Tsukamurella pseudospumae]|uniref:Uncharacterized protein n=1 Tax=Tsukamurella pseudospumae TaxID=239498 RepID=A0A138AV59_9ACTN|nr:helix-turn-helix domain-containing protein [Tsukamurella pseudospumae]KXP14335.1 hypothetical protein AXK60_20495 [Tsukamurella pseudospumae]